MRFPLVIRKVVGHGMVPVLPPGTLVIGWAFIKKLKPGHIVVVEHEGKEKIKRIDQINHNQIFILGDHPETSKDSRHFGWLPKTSVHARVIWPRSNQEAS